MKPTMPTSGWRTMYSPSSPPPWTRLNTPSGSAEVSISAARVGAYGAHSLGFHSTVLPMASEPMQFTSMSTGKFHGAMNAETPIGW